MKNKIKIEKRTKKITIQLGLLFFIIGSLLFLFLSGLNLGIEIESFQNDKYYSRTDFFTLELLEIRKRLDFVQDIAIVMVLNIVSLAIRFLSNNVFFKFVNTLILVVLLYGSGFIVYSSGNLFLPDEYDMVQLNRTRNSL